MMKTMMCLSTAVLMLGCGDTRPGPDASTPDTIVFGDTAPPPNPNTCTLSGDFLSEACVPRCSASTAATFTNCADGDGDCRVQAIEGDSTPGVPFVVNGDSAGTMDCTRCANLAILLCRISVCPETEDAQFSCEQDMCPGLTGTALETCVMTQCASEVTAAEDCLANNTSFDSCLGMQFPRCFAQ